MMKGGMIDDSPSLYSLSLNAGGPNQWGPFLVASNQPGLPLWRECANATANGSQ